MKKLVSILLAVAMVMVMSTAAFAAGSSEILDVGSQDITVKAEYKNNVSAPDDSVCVDILWESMEFTYTVSGNLEWDANKHLYYDNTHGAWTANGNTITVTNHSNIAVTAAFSFAANAGYSSVNGSFNNATINLPSAVGKELTDASLSGTSELTLSGTLSNRVVSMSTVGTITVDIRKQA